MSNISVTGSNIIERTGKFESGEITRIGATRTHILFKAMGKITGIRERKRIFYKKIYQFYKHSSDTWQINVPE